MASSTTTDKFPNRDAFQATASLQLDSSFFGMLPPEIREMIYSEFELLQVITALFTAIAGSEILPLDSDGRKLYRLQYLSSVLSQQLRRI